MAAEAFWEDEGPNSDPNSIAGIVRQGNTHTNKFQVVQAEKFSSEYEVLAHRNNDPRISGGTGFSGTLFRNRSTGELTLSFRSTEFIDDAVRDSKSTNELEIKELGWALGQISEMEAWYAELRENAAVLGGPNFTVKNFNVTGYSLGGHLATAFNILRREEADAGGPANPILNTYTFNGAGTGAIQNHRQLNDIIANFDRLRSLPDITASAEWNALSPAERIVINNRAASRVMAINAETTRVQDLSASFAFGARPPAGAQASLQYQIAALIVGRDTVGASNFPLPGGTNYIPSSPVFADPALRFANMIEVVGTESGALAPSFVSNSGLHIGARQAVVIENQPAVRGAFPVQLVGGLALLSPNLLVSNPDSNSFADTHSLVLLVDSLALMAAMERLAPNLRVETATQIFAAMSKAAASSLIFTQGKADGDTLERMLDALAKLVMGSEQTATLDEKQMLQALGGNTWHLDALRAPFHQKLNELRGRIDALAVSGPFTIDSLANTPAGNLVELAQEPSAYAYRYALRELNPFAVLGPDALYTDSLPGNVPAHNANGELNLYVDAGTTPAGMTAEYIGDRAAMLNYLATANTNDTNVVASNRVTDQALYRDLVKRADGKGTEVLVVLPGGTPNFVGPNTRVIGFGAAGADGLQGRDKTDRLYGGAGADYLRGGKGDDYLEGGAGMDVYGYNAFKVLLSSANDGNDTVRDTDAKGVLRYEFKDGLLATSKSAVIGGAAIEVTPTQWQSPNGKFTYDTQGSDLLVTINGDAGGSIRIKDFDFAKAKSDGYLGIRLVDSPAAPEGFVHAFVGDKQNYDSNPATPDIDLIDDGFGNFVRADGLGGRPDIVLTDRADVFYGSSANEAERFFTAGGDDTVFADGPDSTTSSSGGRDLIETGAGRDVVNAGAGDD